MPTYWITFRLSDDAAHKSTYQTRYDDLRTVITGAATNTDWWTEPTSFAMIVSNIAIDVLAARIKGVINTQVDMVLMRELDKQSARVVGFVVDKDIFVMMPYLKQV